MDARPQTLSTVAGVSSSLFISLFINIRGGGDNSRFRSCMNIHTSAPHFTHDMIYLSICDKKTLATILIYIYTSPYTQRYSYNTHTHGFSTHIYQSSLFPFITHVHPLCYTATHSPSASVSSPPLTPMVFDMRSSCSATWQKRLTLFSDMPRPLKSSKS